MHGGGAPPASEAKKGRRLPCAAASCKSHSWLYCTLRRYKKSPARHTRSVTVRTTGSASPPPAEAEPLPGHRRVSRASPSTTTTQAGAAEQAGPEKVKNFFNAASAAGGSSRAAGAQFNARTCARRAPDARRQQSSPHRPPPGPAAGGERSRCRWGFPAPVFPPAGHGDSQQTRGDAPHGRARRVPPPRSVAAAREAGVRTPNAPAHAAQAR